MDDHHDDLSRRTFLKALGASVALAGLDGCTRIPAEKILPYVTQPPEFTPGTPVHYATSMVLDGYATGLVVEAHEGRPTKIEGNPDHPASLGASSVLHQASLLQLYDPDRARYVRSGSSRASWSAFASAMAPAVLRSRVGARGAGLALLLEPTSSPLLAAQLDELRASYPEMRVHYYAPFVSVAANDAFTTRGLIPQYDIRSADVVLSVGADFLAQGPFHLRYAREFADRRRSPLTEMNRLYVAECGFSVTGAAADHRLRCRPAELESTLVLLLDILRGAHGGPSPASSSPWVDAVAGDLRAHTGRSLVIAGDRLPPRVHALTAAINDTLRNTGRTVRHVQSPLLGAGDEQATIAALGEALRGGGIDTLLCLGGNPAYAAAGSAGLSSLLKRIPHSAYCGLFDNETAGACRWFVPATHYLESWGDARAYDGTYSLVQPLVQPLYDGKSAVQVLAALAGKAAADPRSLLRESVFKNTDSSGDDGWSDAVRRGFVSGTPAQAVVAVPRPELLRGTPVTPSARESIEVVLEPDARVYDGSFANNGWLQELPDPVTKLTWGNAAILSPATAKRIGAATDDAVELRRFGVAVRIPVLVVPGQPDDVATVHFGYGRRGREHVAAGVGVDVYPLWPGPGTFSVNDVSIGRAASSHPPLAITQTHWSMEGRDQARSETLAHYRERNAAPETRKRQPLTIYDPPPRLDAPHQWAMTIDLGTCIGCSACVVACQAENNIPVVGHDEVANSREMHWLRIDRYIEGPPEDPRVVTQPMLCQHCENAPCEYVCPVGATDHSSDGLNEMIYNRCVGTRFCSNNCPYKVRRFNWYDYNAQLSETEQMAQNPDVTVRERGVMEKCTFCVQRIREAEIDADIAGRPLRGDEVKTACQQACPTNAIVFGSLTEQDSDVVRRRAERRVYGVLEELGTSPRVQYLARIRNVNPNLQERA
jgi:Fe-S-cluster-containing dehydrogenase component